MSLNEREIREWSFVSFDSVDMFFLAYDVFVRPQLYITLGKFSRVAVRHENDVCSVGMLCTGYTQCGVVAKKILLSVMKKSKIVYSFREVSIMLLTFLSSALQSL